MVFIGYFTQLEKDLANLAKGEDEDGYHGALWISHH